MRVTVATNKEFYTSIGGGRDIKPKKVHTDYVRKVYCSDCLTMHEENKHREEVK